MRSISHDADGPVWLNLTMPDSAFTVPTEVLDTEKLGTPRLVGQRYENPDGTELTLDKDLLGAERGSHLVPGPLESLEPGNNRSRLA